MGVIVISKTQKEFHRFRKMNRNRFMIAVGCVIIALWVMFYVFIFQDLYLYCNSSVDLILKTTLLVVIVTNIAGVIFGCIVSARDRPRGIMVIALYGTPLLVGAGFLWWLFFGVKI